MKLDDDQILIKKILKGDRLSFEKLMKKYNKRIYNFIFRMVRNEESAMELTQDFFIKIYTVLYKFNFEYKFSTWAYRICYNLVIDHIRKNQVFVNSLEDDSFPKKNLVYHNNIKSLDGLEMLQKEEIKSFVWETVDKIPFKFKELILMRYQQELKYDEIAEITGLPVGTVKNRIFKAKEIIRMEMKKNEMFE